MEANVDSIFQIGSITKVWTATLAMQLLDEGKLRLDAPVREYLSEFAVADDVASKSITVRQLICHTSGFEGDILADTGPGDDALEKFVAELADVPQVFEPGAMFSYNNAGYSVLGRIIEVLRGNQFDRCLRDYLLDPLGLEYAAAGPSEAILHRAAVGHVPGGAAGEQVPTHVWSLPRFDAPAGSMLAMRPQDLLTFARMHLCAGLTGAGERLVTAASAAKMREVQAQVPDIGILARGWGLGWALYDWPIGSAGPRTGSVIGHDGDTIGQAATLRVVPERGVAIAVMQNGGSRAALYEHIVAPVLRALAGVEPPPLPTPNTDESVRDAGPYVGAYSSSIYDSVVNQDSDGRVWLHRRPKGLAAEMGATEQTVELAPWRGHTLVARNAESGLHLPYAFLDADSGRASHLFNSRVEARLDHPADLAHGQ